MTQHACPLSTSRAISTPRMGVRGAPAKSTYPMSLQPRRQAPEIRKGRWPAKDGDQAYGMLWNYVVDDVTTVIYGARRML
jgi:hypothetical protein